MPAGSDDVVIPKAGGLMVIDSDCVALPPPLSVNWTVKPAVPGDEGVPLMIPVGAARLKPCGNVPCDIDQVTGETAPDTARVAEYGEPSAPFGSAAVVITGLELMVIVMSFVSTLGIGFAASVTKTVNRDVPLFWGVPVMLPSRLSVSPVGGIPNQE